MGKSELLIMSTRTKHSKFGATFFATTAVALGLGFALSAAADAPKKLPAALTSLASYENSKAKDAVTRDAGQRMVADAQTGLGLTPLHARYRNIKLLSFRHEVEVMKEDVIVKVQSPGKRRSFMMLELKF